MDSSKRSSTTSCGSVSHESAGASISVILTGPTSLVRTCSSVSSDLPPSSPATITTDNKRHSAGKTQSLTVPDVTSQVLRRGSSGRRHGGNENDGGAVSDSEVSRKTSARSKAHTVGPSGGRRMAARVSSSTEQMKRGSSDSIDSDTSNGNATPVLKNRNLRISDSSSISSMSTTSSVRSKLRVGSKRPTRRISCKDLGSGQCQGWLLKRKDSKGLATNKWSTRWCVLHKNSLYYYKSAEWGTAEGVIYLPGFKISPAPEIKQKKFAFKAHHTGMTFYFAAERQDDMAKWMNKLGLASLELDKVVSVAAGLLKPELRAVKSASNIDVRRVGDEVDQSSSGPYYSESDDSQTPSVSNSREDLTELYRNIRRADLDLAGSNVKNRRSTVFMAETSLCENSEHDILMRRLLSLKRTVKDKEQRLAAIEQFFEQCSTVTSDALRTFIEHNLYIAPVVDLSAALVASSDRVNKTLRLTLRDNSQDGDSDTTLDSSVTQSPVTRSTSDSQLSSPV